MHGIGPLHFYKHISIQNMTAEDSMQALHLFKKSRRYHSKSPRRKHRWQEICRLLECSPSRRVLHICIFKPCHYLIMMGQTWPDHHLDLLWQESLQKYIQYSSNCGVSVHDNVIGDIIHDDAAILVPGSLCWSAVDIIRIWTSSTCTTLYWSGAETSSV